MKPADRPHNNGNKSCDVSKQKALTKLFKRCVIPTGHVHPYSPCNNKESLVLTRAESLYARARISKGPTGNTVDGARHCGEKKKTATLRVLSRFSSVLANCITPQKRRAGASTGIHTHIYRANFNNKIPQNEKISHQ